MMMFKSRIKRVVLLVLVLSLASLLLHLTIAKFSRIDLVDYNPMTTLPNASMFGVQGFRNKRLWGAVQPLLSLHPYANPRSTYPLPKEQSNGFIYAKIFGGFAKIRSSICDLVTVSRLLNATLVIPEIQASTRSKGISNSFKSFSYLYNEEEFIAALKSDVTIVKSLPENLKAARRGNKFPTFKLKNTVSPDYYIEEILPKLKKSKVIGLILNDGGCLQSILPPSMSELQRLRCRVAFHALEFRPDIQILGHKMVERLRAWQQPFLAFHPGLVRDMLAYHGCAELFQDVHTELIQYRRAQMIKHGIISDKLSVDSFLRRDNGTCPITPEEVGILLRAMGYPPKTIIYLAGSETFGGQRMLIPLRAMFSNVVDRTSLCSNQELERIVGPEAPLPLNIFQMPPVKLEKQEKDEWNRAGPRPRPLPPPPDRPIYRHEKEGWYGWITENDTEPDLSLVDLRQEAHRLLWDALDYFVSVEADAFFPGFNNDGSGWPDFSSLVMGQRLYESAFSRTYRPDRKVVAKLFNSTIDDMYHPWHNWTLLVQDHLNKSLGEEGVIRESLLSKQASFLSHPLPECSCRVSSSDVAAHIKDTGGRTLYGGEDECPEWMKHGEDVKMETEGEEGEKWDETEFLEYEKDLAQQLELTNYSTGKENMTQFFDQDEEMDPND